MGQVEAGRLRGISSGAGSLEKLATCHPPNRPYAFSPASPGFPSLHPPLGQSLTFPHPLPPPSLFKVYPGVRNILNLNEVIEQCNRHDWSSVLQGTKWKSVECCAYAFGNDMYESMAVAQQTDVFMSLHGSGDEGGRGVQKEPLTFEC